MSGTRDRMLRAALLAVVVVVTIAISPATDVAAGGRCAVAIGTVTQRVAAFWTCVNALGPSDHLVADDIGQWARNVIDLDPSACIPVSDFRASSGAMQIAIDAASVGIAPAPARSPDVEGRIATFWSKIDALGGTGLLAAADLGQWALNLIDRDPSREISVSDFRATTAGMQLAFDRAKAARALCVPPSRTPTPTPSAPPPSASPTATVPPSGTAALYGSISGSVLWGPSAVTGFPVQIQQGDQSSGDRTILATPLTDGQGRFLQEALHPGTYIVHPRLDAGSPYVTVKAPEVVVTVSAGSVTTTPTFYLLKSMTLLSPVPNGSATSPVTFYWSAVNGATQYSFFLCACDSPLTTAPLTTVTLASLTLQLRTGRYCWAVSAQTSRTDIAWSVQDGAGGRCVTVD